MPDKPPDDSADQAEDFARRSAQELDIATGQTPKDLGMDPTRLSSLSPKDLQSKTFHPGDFPGRE